MAVCFKAYAKFRACNRAAQFFPEKMLLIFLLRLRTPKPPRPT
jgi:hypothetical protein